MYELISVNDNEFEDLLGERDKLTFFSDGIGFCDLLMKPKRKLEQNNKVTVWTILGNKFVFKKVI